MSDSVAYPDGRVGGRRLLRPPVGAHLRAARRARTFIRRLTGSECWHRVQLRCNREFHGSEYGGWWICPDHLNDRSIVYSAGVGEDISFDISLVERFNLNIFAFDPTPRVIEWIAKQELPPNLIFHPYGLASSDGTRRFFPPSNPADVSYSIVPRSTTGAVDIAVRSLATILHTLGHSRIDLLKIDIEGAEYDVIDDMLARHILPPQLLIEFHHGRKYGSLTLADKKRAISRLLNSGYRITAISDIGMEYSFIHDDLA